MQYTRYLFFTLCTHTEDYLEHFEIEEDAHVIVELKNEGVGETSESVGILQHSSSYNEFDFQLPEFSSGHSSSSIYSSSSSSGILI